MYRGKGLGGSSATNFYLWNRPGEEDINGTPTHRPRFGDIRCPLTTLLCSLAWERLGNPGWNWKNFLKYSIKCEKYVLFVNILPAAWYVLAPRCRADAYLQAYPCV